MHSTPTPPEATTEETPLLSGASSQTPRNDAYSTESGIESPRSANHSISVWRGLAVGVSLWLLIFLQASNMSGMTMIQGVIARDLQAYSSAMWFTSAYLIPMSSLAPVTGRLATIFPPRALVFPVTLCIAVGSVLCAGAQSLAVFLVGRAVAGVGGAGVLTLAVIFVLELTGEKRRGVFVGLVNAGFTLGVSFGAVVFGGLLPVTGWRPLFWIQAPCAVVASLGVYFSIPAAMESSPKQGTIKERLAQIDYLGASLLTLTIILFLYGLAGEIQYLPLLLSLTTLTLFLLAEYRLASDPIIPLKVLSSRGILFSCLAQLGLMSARWTVLFYTPIFMLAVRGAAPAAAGSVLIPTNLGFGLGGILVGWLHIKRSGAFWLSSIVSVALFCSSLYALSLVGTPAASIAAFLMAVTFNGLATRAGINYTLAHALHLSHEDTQYVTTSLIATFRGFGGSFGTAIGGGIFYRNLRSGLTSGFLSLDGGDGPTPAHKRLISRLLGSPELVFSGDMSEREQHVAVEGYAGASRSVWQVAAALGLGMVAVQATTGWTAPNKEVNITDEDARANVTENEGVGEA